MPPAGRFLLTTSADGSQGRACVAPLSVLVAVVSGAVSVLGAVVGWLVELDVAGALADVEEAVGLVPLDVVDERVDTVGEMVDVVGEMVDVEVRDVGVVVRWVVVGAVVVDGAGTGARAGVGAGAGAGAGAGVSVGRVTVLAGRGVGGRAGSAGAVRSSSCDVGAGGTDGAVALVPVGSGTELVRVAVPGVVESGAVTAGT
jgi:hypothetical protein